MKKNFLMKTGLPGEQNLFNKGFRLEITHLPTDYTVAFSAIIEQMSDAYNSEWNAEQVYGRMDPIGTYSHTTRAISVAWKVPASSLEMAKDNLDKANRLASFLYPTYADSVGATSISQGPMWGVKFGNLICNAKTAGPLLGWVRGITVDPILEDGVFIDEFSGTAAINARPPVGVAYYPKTLRLNFELRVTHEHDLGWIEGGGAAPFVFKGGSRLKLTDFAMGKSAGMPFPYISETYVSEPIDEGTPPKPPAPPPRDKVVDEIVDPTNLRRTVLVRRDPNSPGGAAPRGITARSKGRPLIKRKGQK